MTTEHAQGQRPADAAADGHAVLEVTGLDVHYGSHAAAPPRAARRLTERRTR